MVRAALLRNTLVCLPTGLGKTLIAAVLMYNYRRWFPDGQIIFMAPTKPLVAQQVEACHNVVGIPEADTAEMSGNSPSEVRRQIWERKRVFYATPQTVENDLENHVLDARRIVLVVIDEAHRAHKNYAYCGVVRAIARVQCHFRVLALSATPGSSLQGVQDVIDNLRIAHVEVRTEDDPEVAPYTHARLIEKVTCEQSSDLRNLSKIVCDVARPVLRRLESAGAIRSADANVLTAFSVLKARNDNSRRPGVNFPDFILAHKLVSIHDALKNYGVTGALQKVDFIATEAAKTRERLERGEMDVASGDRLIAHFVLQDDFKHMRDALSRGSTEHPKTGKLREILLEHFKRAHETGTSSRAMVFTGTRNSVDEIVQGLESSRNSMLRCIRFTGQGGMKQREQKAVVARFQANEFNVLVATCVAEEGLDIGCVDLCVFYDQIGSPIRLVQRMGRTGRKRTGRVILLLAPGEDRKFDSGGRKNAMVVHSLYEAARNFQLRFALSKRMIPRSLVPQWPQMVQTKFDISEWHASQVAGVSTEGIARRGKSAPVKERNVLTVDDAVASWRLNETSRNTLDEAGWDKDWAYKPLLGDGWRQYLRARNKPTRAILSTVVGDVVRKPSLRAKILHAVARFVRNSQWSLFYDPDELDRHNGKYAGLIVASDCDDAILDLSDSSNNANDLTIIADRSDLCHDGEDFEAQGECPDLGWADRDCGLKASGRLAQHNVAEKVLASDPWGWNEGVLSPLPAATRRKGQKSMLLSKLGGGVQSVLPQVNRQKGQNFARNEERLELDPWGCMDGISEDDAQLTAPWSNGLRILPTSASQDRYIENDHEKKTLFSGGGKPMASYDDEVGPNLSNTGRVDSVGDLESPTSCEHQSLSAGLQPADTPTSGFEAPRVSLRNMLFKPSSQDQRIQPRKRRRQATVQCLESVCSTQRQTRMEQFSSAQIAPLDVEIEMRKQLLLTASPCSSTDPDTKRSRPVFLSSRQHFSPGSSFMQSHAAMHSTESINPDASCRHEVSNLPRSGADNSYQSRQMSVSPQVRFEKAQAEARSKMLSVDESATDSTSALRQTPNIDLNSSSPTEEWRKRAARNREEARRKKMLKSALRAEAIHSGLCVEGARALSPKREHHMHTNRGHCQERTSSDERFDFEPPRTATSDRLQSSMPASSSYGRSVLKNSETFECYMTEPPAEPETSTMGPRLTSESQSAPFPGLAYAAIERSDASSDISRPSVPLAFCGTTQNRIGPSPMSKMAGPLTILSQPNHADNSAGECSMETHHAQNAVISISEEQRRRMEQNKERAMKLRAERELRKASKTLNFRHSLPITALF